MRICIVAENASKLFGGEAILPYQYFRVLRDQRTDVCLVVHARTRAELQSLFPHDHDRMFFVEDLLLQKIFFRLGTFLPRRISESTFGLATQLLTQLQQRSLIRRLVRDRGIDVIHQPIPVAPRFPSLLYRLGAPVIIGPMNGGMDYPPGFNAAESLFSRIFVTIARSFSNVVNAILPGKKQAAIVLVANERTRKVLPSGLRGHIVQLPEIGVDLAEWKLSTGRSPTRPPTFVFMGRLVDWKALDIAIRALATTPAAHIDVIGDGPMLAPWKLLAANLGVADRVDFIGWQSQAECARRVDDAVALILPSIYECGGAVVIEAMAMAKPVIATRWGGPADSLDATCGILVEPESPEALVAGFAAAMQRLIDSPKLCDQLGAAGRNKLLQAYDWDKKVDIMTALYASLLPSVAPATQPERSHA
jgi:glycosyltransferase involved in cell wall biosynthesis